MAAVRSAAAAEVSIEEEEEEEEEGEGWGEGRGEEMEETRGSPHIGDMRLALGGREGSDEPSNSQGRERGS